MIDIDDPDALPELRRFIVSVGLDPSGLTDDEVQARVRALLEERVPAPAVGFGDQPINGREWFAAALTAGGFRQPEDRGRRAVVDAGEPVHLVVLAILVMRHLPNARPPQPWTDESLVAQSGQPVEGFARAQRLLDEVAADVGVPPRLGPRWWEQ
jgi:hypothetical protein